ncbi:hypothetical protein LTR37_018583 [Vermiconidia calcicola]|uniref:Uncharacterized protein n=1 Tax=Vermiconidia calcicola TaxID=1690605 RepID=A0ACC3MGX5_9PEZI|nr:hypothetical protein LTR37_018583 [Vermiconidia calcicola]
MGSLSNTEIGIPVIDLSSSNRDAPSQLLDAATKYGFVFIENNDVGVPTRDISDMFNLSESFFAAPVEEKQKISIASNQAGKNHGWLSRGIEKLDPATQQRADVKEALNIGEQKNGELQQPMTELLEPHIRDIKRFQDSCHKFCQRIFERLAEGLDIEISWFTSRHDRTKGPSGTVLRLLYYPHVGDLEDFDLRAGAHSDFGSITLLFQLPGQPGLEIKTPSGEWAAVAIDPHSNMDRNAQTNRTLPILVNIGDLLEDWTGGLLKSTVHRVIFPQSEEKSDRYSIAYFCHPLDDAELAPVPSKAVQDHATRTGKRNTRDGKVLTAKDHLMERLEATYSIK